MSETSPQSLASAIAQQSTPDSGESAPSRPSTPAPKIPSLEALINSNVSGSGDAPLAEGSAAIQQQPLQPPSAVSPVPQAPAETQEQARLRSLLTQRGFTIPEDLATDDSIADLIAAQLDQSTAYEQSDEFKAFQAWQAQQKTALETPVTAPAAQPVTPTKPQEIAESALLSAISNGFVTHDAESKKWTSTHPAFAQHADTMNARDARTQQIKVALATDPEGYIQQQVEARIKDFLASQTGETKAPTDELKEVLNQFKQQQTQAQISQIEAWGNANASRLYDASGAKTPFYHLYESFYTDLSKADPTFDQRPLERHNEILRRVTAAEKAFRPTQPAAPPQAPAKPQTFLEGAAARRNGVNRLSEYAGPARNAVSPQIPTGGMGIPSLGGIINQMTTLAEN